MKIDSRIMLNDGRVVLNLLLVGFAFTSVAFAEGRISGTIPATRAQRAQWASMAKISIDEAKEIALRATSGTVDDVDLELEDGFLVYEVEINDSADQEHEFVIDAGNGTILKKTTDD